MTCAMPVNTRQNHGMQNALEALEEIVQQNGLARSWEDEGLGTTVTLTIRRDEYLILYQAVCSWKDGTKKDVHHNLAQNFVTWWRCIFEILEGCLHYNRSEHQWNISVQGVSLRASDRHYRTVFQCHAKWAARVVGAHRAIGCVFFTRSTDEDDLVSRPCWRQLREQSPRKFCLTDCSPDGMLSTIA